jgi:dolichol kinase
MANEFSRQLIHLFAGLLFALLAWFAGIKLALGFAIIVLAVGIVVSVFAWKFLEKHPLNELLKHVERKHERQLPGKAALMLLLAIIVVLLLFYRMPLEVATGSLLVLAFGDSFSTIIGKKFGKTKIVGKKTLEGTIAGIIAGFIPLLLLIAPLQAFTAALAGMLAELLPIDDNFTVPIAAGIVLMLL